MGYYLLDNPNRHGPHYYTTRTKRIFAIVVHITAGLEDLDTVDDHSAENTARYAATTDRPVSWHSGSDADTAFDLLPYSYTAFQCKGYNSSTYGHEISKKHPDWRNSPEPWKSRTIRLAAQHLGPKARRLGIPIRKATKAELDYAIATNGAPVGFVSHWELDPERRRDPGKVVENNLVIDTFPWRDFLTIAAGGTKPPEPETKRYRKMYCFFIDDSGDGKVWLTDFLTKRWMQDQEELNQNQFLIKSSGAPMKALDRSKPWPAHMSRRIPVVS